MPDWLSALTPHTASEWWTAIGAIATSAAVIFAVRATRYAAQTVRVEQAPVLALEQQPHGIVSVRNLGRGIAFNVVITGEDGKVAHSQPILAPGANAEVDKRLIARSLAEGNAIYCQDMAGRWLRTVAVYRGFDLSDASSFWNRIEGEVWSIRIPRQVRLALRTAERSSLEHLDGLNSYLSWEGWGFRAGRARLEARLGVPRRWHRVGEANRVARFRTRLDSAPRPAVPKDDRADWEFDISGDAACWKGLRRIDQQTCDWDGEVLVCEVSIRTLVNEVRGVLAIDRRAFLRLSADPAERRESIRERFYRYVCGLRPEGPFAFHLRQRGPLLINDVF